MRGHVAIDNLFGNFWKWYYYRDVNLSTAETIIISFVANSVYSKYNIVQSKRILSLRDKSFYFPLAYYGWINKQGRNAHSTYK